MKESIIWNISNGKDLPLQLWKHPKISISKYNVPYRDLSQIQLSPNVINVIFVHLDQKEWDEIEDKILEDYGYNSKVHLFLITSISETIKIKGKKSGNFEILESPIKAKEIRLILDKSIQAEFYKETALEIGNGCLSNIGFFEGLFDLARLENKTSQDAVKAFEKMMEYEIKIKASNNEIYKAMENVNSFRETELIQLHERIKATEKLDELRELELKNAIEEREATEKALLYSRVEEIQMDKIIKAQERIFVYTDQEILALINENADLKRKLGIKN